jgi:V8-like Glu-specific endopeptidase
MEELKSVSNSGARSPFESMDAAEVARTTPGAAGSASDERSRSRRILVRTGRGEPLRGPFESVIGVDERVRILDTDLAPWRMICALRMTGPGGVGAIGTGWFVGPKTLLTAGHCVYSSQFFGGWAERIEVIPGLNGTGAGPEVRPFGSVTSSRFSSTKGWADSEHADFDIGCIHLDEPLGEAVGWFSLGVRSAADLTGFMLNISGYPADRGNGNEQYHGVNRVLQVSDRRVFYEVDTFGGQSGAPVWIHESPDGPPIAVAVHAYGTGGTPAAFGITANSAPRIIPEVFDLVSGWIEDDGGEPAG